MGTVTEPRAPEHEEIIDLLPDYAVGALDDASLWRVAAHVDTCTICQREMSFLLETVSFLAMDAAPGAALRQAVVQHASRSTAGADQTPASPGPQPRPSSTTPPVPLASRRRLLAGLGVAAAVAIVAIGIATWAIVGRDGDERENEDAILAALVLDPDAAHPINDSELDFGAGGVMFTDETTNLAYVVASGLPLPERDEQYQVWLFTESGERISAGFLPVDAAGVGQGAVRAPTDFAAYWAVGVSLEPAGGSDAPTTPLVVGGWLR